MAYMRALISTLLCLGLTLSTAVTGMASAAVLEEVIVTAQKREQQLQDVGISVTAFSGKQIDALGYANANEITAMAPGVHTVQPNGEANYALSIRGAAQSDLVANQESPVSIYVDEVYVSQMSGAGFMLFDLERVEILRGPQGTLFGRNATGGLAHFITRKPRFERDAYGEFTFGEYDQIKFQGAVGGGLSKTLAARLSISTHHNSGYIRNRTINDDINNANDYAGRVQLLFEPNEDVSLLLNGRYSLQQIRTGFFENVSSATLTARGGVLTPSVPNFNGYIDTDGDVFAGDYDKQGHNDLETYGFSGTLKWDFGNLTLTSISDFQSVERDYIEDTDATPLADFNFFLSTDSEQFSQELRLASELERTRWVVGFYYLDIDIADANGAEIPLLGIAAAFGDPTIALIDGAGNSLGFDSPYTLEKRSWSLFGQVEYDLTERFTGIAGLRWIDEDVDAEYDSNFVAFIPGTQERNGNPNIIAPMIPHFESNYNKGLWSARAEIDFRYNDDWLWYASWNRGVKGGGFNAPFDVSRIIGGINIDSMKFNEEEVDAFELGFKSTWWGGKARLNGSIYYNDYDDTYQAFEIRGLSTNIVNLEADAAGMEMEFTANPIDGMDFLFGLAWIDMDMKTRAGPDLTGAFIPSVKTTAVQTPKWNVNGLLRYGWPMYGGELAVQGDFLYRSEHYFSITRAEAVTEDGYIIGNARVSYATDDGKWEAAFFVKNLAGEEYIVQTFDLSDDLGMTEQYYGRPRWIGGSIRYTWD